MENPALRDVLAQLQSHLGPLRVAHLDHQSLSIMAGRSESSMATITCDECRPGYFNVSCMTLPPDSTSVRQAELRTSQVVLQGLLWVVKELRDHGYVLPEFPAPKLRRSLEAERRSASRKRRRQDGV